MNSKKLIAILFFLTIAALQSLYSQVYVFDTYDDFISNNFIQYDDFTPLKDGPYGEVFSFKVVKGSETTRIKPKNIWGFVYKDALFRIDHYSPDNCTARLISDGTLLYYENGYHHIKMLIAGKDTASYFANIGYTAYVSLGLNSNMIPLSRGTNLLDKKRAKNKRKKFRKANPEHDVFFECLRNSAIETIRRCIMSYNETGDSK